MSSPICENGLEKMLSQPGRNLQIRFVEGFGAGGPGSALVLSIPGFLVLGKAKLGQALIVFGDVF